MTNYGETIKLDRQEVRRSGEKVPYTALMERVQLLRNEDVYDPYSDGGVCDGIEQGREQVLDEIEYLLKELADEEVKRMDELRERLVRAARNPSFIRPMRESEDPNKQFHHALKYEDH